MKNNQRNKAGTSSLHYIILIASTPRKYTEGYEPRATHQQVASFHRGSYFHTSFTQKKKKKKEKSFITNHSTTELTVPNKEKATSCVQNKKFIEKSFY